MASNNWQSNYYFYLGRFHRLHRPTAMGNVGRTRLSGLSVHTRGTREKSELVPRPNSWQSVRKPTADRKQQRRNNDEIKRRWRPWWRRYDVTSSGRQQPIRIRLESWH